VVLNLFFEICNLLCLLADAFGALLDAFGVLGWVGMDFAAEITLIGHGLALLQIERVLEIWVIISVAVDVYVVVLRVEKLKLHRIVPLPVEQRVGGLLFNFDVCDFDRRRIDFEVFGFLFIGFSAIVWICIDGKYPRRDMRSLPYVILMGTKQEAHRAGGDYRMKMWEKMGILYIPTKQAVKQDFENFLVNRITDWSNFSVCTD
jgi:hypothetical protein